LARIAAGGKRALAEALAALEARPGDADVIALLDAAFAVPRAHVIGLTGPPGVGKSTLINALISHWRGAGLTVGVIVVDPSSEISGGALLGDRTRLTTDPQDDGVFVRSMATRGRLGGIAQLTVAATVLMRAIFDRVLVETVGIGQSETDIIELVDTTLFCVQPASGDSLQFMKAGIMEVPDVVAVNKADLGAAADRAAADVLAALSIAARGEGWSIPVHKVSAMSADGVPELAAVLEEHRGFLEQRGLLDGRRREQASGWLTEAIERRFGSFGLEQPEAQLQLEVGEGPFARLAEAQTALERRFTGAPAPAAVKKDLN
jgi:LAO/AO transport system kinase